jgi:hypothetical protein
MAFLIQTLRIKGYSPTWIQWVETFISGGSAAINVNVNMETLITSSV